MENKKKQEEILERLLLLMSYDQKKTFSENLSKIKKDLQKEQKEPSNNLYYDLEVIKQPGGRTTKIPKFENSKKIPCKTNQEFWTKVANEKIPQEKRKEFLNKITKETSVSDSVCAFNTPDGKTWVYNYQWGTTGTSAFIPNHYYYAQKGKNDSYYFEKDYVKIKRGVNDFAPEDAEQITKIKANPNIGIEGPFDVSGNLLPKNVLKIEDTQNPKFLKWRIYNNSTEPMSFNNISIKNLPIQYQDKLKWDKKKVLDENGEFLEVFLELTYKQDEVEKPKENTNAVKQISTSANSKLNEQNNEETQSNLQSFEGKIKLPVQAFALDVDTNLGNTGQNVIIDESPEVKYKTTSRVLKDRALNRKSVYGEKEVPEGYSPFTYDEYLQRKSELEKFIRQYGESTPTGIAITPKVLNSMSPDIKNYYNELQSRLTALGYSSKFPKGITPEDKTLFFDNKNKFKKELEELESQLEQLKDSYYIESTDAMGGTYGDYNSQMYKDKDYIELTQRIEKLKEELKVLNYRYGYDDRSWFDKFWDDYGLTIQIGLAILTAVLSFGATAPASGGFIVSMLVRAGVTAQAAARMSNAAKALSALDTYMNVGLGTYFAIKGDGLNALMSLFFALLPKIHTLYGKIGDYFGPKISQETAERLQKLFANTPINSQDDLNAILAQMSNAEKKYVYAFMKTPDNVIADALKAAQDDMNRIAAAEGKQAAETLQIPLGSSSKLIAGGKLVGTLAIDYAIIKNIEHMYDAVISKVNCFCRAKNGKPCNSQQNTPEGRKGTIEDFEKYKFDCLVSPEERNQWRSYLSKLTPAEFENLKNLLNFIALNTTPQGQVVIEKAIIKNGVSENTLKTVKTFQVKEAIDKLKKSGVDPNEAIDDFIKELERQANLDQNKPLDVPIEMVTDDKIKSEQIDNSGIPQNVPIEK